MNVRNDVFMPTANRNKQPAIDMVIWNEQFTTGSEPIDQQHRTLINNINGLESLLTDTNPTPVQWEFLTGLVDFLELYAKTHFSFEERCMQRYRCPVHEKNKQAHEQFLNFFVQFKERHKAEGVRPDHLKQLHKLLSSWVEDHILRVDTHLKHCIQKRD